MEKYGFIGLGDQGAPIARRMIDAGLPVVLWARRPASLEPFAGTPAERADSIEDLARRVDYVGICVVDDNGVRLVFDQLIPHLRAGSTIAIHSTVSPALCRALAAEASARALNLIDAPVSGGSPAAVAGKLTVMVGGHKPTLEAVRPVLETFSNLIVHLGDVGAGQHAKLINNSLLAANIGLAHHALAAAEELSLDRAAFVEHINASSGRSFGFEVCGRLPEPSAFFHGASLLAKDVSLLGDALKEHACFAPIESAASAFLKSALQLEDSEAGEKAAAP
jgi:3-hydroxyisobutyrate dehydrogenase-like beta-hydroxyacid dehydrogenase